MMEIASRSHSHHGNGGMVTTSVPQQHQHVRQSASTVQRSSPTKQSHGGGSRVSNQPTMNNNKSYLLEHLATLNVSAENDVVSPADGMRKLLSMEKSNGIWTQKMLMRIDESSRIVYVMDHDNGEIVEQFPLSLIRQPTAFTSNDPNEIYNNILIYVVDGSGLEDNGRHHNQYSDNSVSDGHSDCEGDEMHIFQCVNARARDVVELLKSSLRRQSSSQHMTSRGDGQGSSDFHSHRRHHHPSPLHSTNPVSDRRDGEVGDHVSPSRYMDESVVSRRKTAASKLHDPHHDGTNSSTTSLNSSSDRYERDVTILNRCFDDIERFVGRLQDAASAFQQLEKKRKSKKGVMSRKSPMGHSSSPSSTGEGMLLLRARSPPETEFIDVFQKFKLSFNLLAKLKSHIHNPNAPELVHFLFTPLALIADASHDAHYGPEFPSKVIVPLLTPLAIELLENCLTSKENELWHSLGESWLISHIEWSEHHHDSSHDDLSSAVRRQQHNMPRNLCSFRPVFSDGWSPLVHFDDISHAQSYNDRVGTAHSVSDTSSIFNSSHGAQHTRGQMSNSVIGSKHPPPPPSSHHHDQRRSNRESSSTSAVNCSANRVQVTYPRTANNDKELSVVRGEILDVLDDSRKWWKTRNQYGQVGFIPHTIVTRDIQQS